MTKDMQNLESGSTITLSQAESLIKLMTYGLVNIKDTTGQFLLKLADGGYLDTKGWNAWEWTHGVALTALYKHYAISPTSPGNQKSLDTALQWFRDQYKITNGKGTAKNINTMAPFYCLASAVEDGAVPEEERAQWLEWLDEWAEWIIHGLPRTEENGFQHSTFASNHTQNIWDDTLMMTIIPLVKIGKVLNRPQYIEEAKYQMLLHIQYLMDPVTGLWYHGWEFTPEDNNPLHKGHNFGRIFWARGNAWVTVSIPMFIEILELKPQDPLYQFLASTFRRQCDSLVRTQDRETGLWHTVLMDKTSYVETSASAGFASGMFMGLKMGLLKGDDYLNCATAALKGVTAQIQSDGEVANVSFGTGAGWTVEHYTNIPITPMPYGQALALWALVEWEGMQIS